LKAFATAIITVLVFGIFWKFFFSNSGMFATTSHLRSEEGRINIAKAGVQLFRLHPWNGIGIGNFAHANCGNPSVFHNGYVPQAFNWYIELAAEQGFTGIVLFSFAAAAFVLQAIRTRQPYGALYIAAFLSLLIFGMGESNWGESRSLYDMIAVACGLLRLFEDER
jgi:O-antigen ligase